MKNSVRCPKCNGTMVDFVEEKTVTGNILQNTYYKIMTYICARCSGRRFNITYGVTDAPSKV